MKRFQGGLVFKAHRLLYHSSRLESHKEEAEKKDNLEEEDEGRRGAGGRERFGLRALAGEYL